ncbi:hypothetical protein JB92DRAFT_2897532 [Gautieria morchelliformis]|nr:hypothetical protein JB92DRAFT_2897532 [Gautieria morchelliformis]
MSFYVFSLPPDLLATLVPRTLIEPTLRIPSPPPTSRPSALTTGSKSCSICLGASFADVDDQRAHFHSDWHRYNVKLRLRGADVVTESQFASLVEGLEDSLSGSASEDEDESDDSSPDAVRALLSRSRDPARAESPTPAIPQPPRTALTWFHSPPSTQIGIYNALFPLKLQQASYLSVLKDMQRGGPNGRRWTMLMVAGGHFAGLVAQVRRPDEAEAEEEASGGKGKKKKLKPKPEVEVIRHKTFHRYTTRRKQGGSQSVNDNAKGPAKSAGAQLRRYGEQALRDDIRNLMSDWADDVASSEIIWIRASVSNKRIFYDYDDAVVGKGDERLRNFPFPTRRPTQSELTRCLNELTRVKFSHLTEDALRAQDEAYLASLPKPKPVPAPAPIPVVVPKLVTPRLTKEEEAQHEIWHRLVEMVTKGRVEPFKALWERDGALLGGINARVPDREATLLHLSAQAGQEQMTQVLLEDFRADPTIGVEGEEREDLDAVDSDTSDAPQPISALSKRAAYDLAKTREVRNVFRRCAAAHPEWWDWLGTGRVPSVLSREMEEGREERKKSRRKGLKEKIRERQAKLEEAAPPPAVELVPAVVKPKETSIEGPRRLGGSAGGQDGVAGLSADMRTKVERERRARAAEARLKALGGRH